MSFRNSLSEVGDLPGGGVALLDRLHASSAEIAEELADAVERAVPERHRETTDRGCRPLCRTLVPVALECIARGTKPDEEELHPIRLSGRQAIEDNVPVSVTLAGISAAMARFAAIVARHASPQDAAAVLVVVGRAAILLQLFMTVYVSGSESDPRKLPGWWSEQPPVAKESLSLVARGRSTGEIARELHYSEQAITYHLGRLMRLFGCSNRTELVGRAHEAGVIGEAVEAARGGAA